MEDDRQVDLDEIESVQILWANFEKAICLANNLTAQLILSDLAWAKSQSLPAACIRVADEVRSYLEPIAVSTKSSSAIARLSPGTLFRYVGPAYGRGFSGLNPETNASVGRIRIRSRDSSDYMEGEARLSHSLAESVTNLTDNGFQKYVLGLVLQTGTRFVPLLLGVTFLDFSGPDRQRLPRYRAINLRSAPAFTDHVIQAFRREIESGHLWTLFDEEHVNSAIRGERRLQYMFESFCNIAAGEFDPSVDPQTNHGAGSVDLCVSRGSRDSCCVELKMSNHKDLSHGLSKQLPSYMTSKGTIHGRFVVLCREESPAPSAFRAKLDVIRHHLPKELDIAIAVIDGRSRPSASRA